MKSHSILTIRLTAHGATPDIFDAVSGKKGSHEAFWKSFEMIIERNFILGVWIPSVQ